jgi:hypothetical protein
MTRRAAWGMQSNLVTRLGCEIGPWRSRRGNHDAGLHGESKRARPLSLAEYDMPCESGESDGDLCSESCHACVSGGVAHKTACVWGKPAAR